MAYPIRPLEEMLPKITNVNDYVCSEHFLMETIWYKDMQARESYIYKTTLIHVHSYPILSVLYSVLQTQPTLQNLAMTKKYQQFVILILHDCQTIQIFKWYIFITNSKM